MAFLEKLKEIEARLVKIAHINESIRASGKFTALENDLVKDHLRLIYELYDELSRAVDSTIPAPPVMDRAAHEEEPVVEPTVIPEPAVSEPEAIEQEPVAEEIVLEQEPEESTLSLFEKFQSGPGTKEVNTSSLSEKPLKEIIPLNDKFMFIKEFFDNSISKYDEMLNKLENAGKKERAVDYMKENVWSQDIFEKNEELIDRFISILDSKFKD